MKIAIIFCICTYAFFIVSVIVIFMLPSSVNVEINGSGSEVIKLDRPAGPEKEILNKRDSGIKREP